MNATRALTVIAALVLSTLACTLQAGQEELADLAATATAQALTLQAPTATSSTATAMPVTGVDVNVTSNTNCRTGPSQAFDLVFTANPGPTFKVVGKNTPTGYWIINNPTGGTCWLWGQYALITGDPNTLPEFPAPPEPAPGPTKTPKPTDTPSLPAKPSAPGDFKSGRSCNGEMDGPTPIWREIVWMTWIDTADNEQGYGVYQNGILIETLPKDTVTYGFNFTYNQGTGGPLFDTMAVEAYNITGSSSRPAVDVGRCP